jgi:hypothetical protein
MIGRVIKIYMEVITTERKYMKHQYMYIFYW